MDPIKIYDYLCATREKILDAVQQLSQGQYERKHPFGPGGIAHTLTHTMNAEWYYIERIEGREVPPYKEWPIQDEAPPPCDALRRAWSEVAKATRGSVAGVKDWSRPVSWESFPNEKNERFLVKATAGGLFTQLAFHEVHHRAQVMAMLKMLGSGVPHVEDLDFNLMTFERTPLVRAS